MAKPTERYVIIQDSLFQRLLTRQEAIALAKKQAIEYQRKYYVLEVKEFYDYVPPKGEPSTKRGYLK